jgi:hypothetical protein
MRESKADHNTPDLEDERTTAIGLARYAYEYLDAAMLVEEHHGARPGHEEISPIPAYYLASHAIELTLKAFLRHRGIPVRHLRSSKHFGHNLRACYRKAKELGLKEIFKANSNDLRAFWLLIQLNQQHELRYIRTGLKRFPSWAIVEPLAVRLHQAVSPHVGYRKTFSKTYYGALYQKTADSAQTSLGVSEAHLA